MTSWDDRLNEHGLWTKLSEFQTALGELELPDDEANARDSRDYMENIVALVSARRAATDSLQLTTAMLDAVAAAIDSTHAYMSQSWTPGGNDGAMDTQAQSIVQALAGWPAPTPEQVAEAHASAAQRIQDATEATLEAVHGKRDEILAALKSLADQQESLETKVSEQTQAITDATANFATSSKDALAESDQEWTDSRDRQLKLAEGNLKTLNELEQQARDLVHAATSSVVATDYGEYAKKETFAGWICDISAALVGAIGVAAILYHLFTAGDGADSNIGLSLTRLAASIGALGVAALVGKRGNQHHREARAAKRTDLAIRQVGPFVANLAKEERELVVAEVTDRIFIKGELDSTTPRENLVDKVRRMRQERDAPSAGTGRVA